MRPNGWREAASPPSRQHSFRENLRSKRLISPRRACCGRDTNRTEPGKIDPPGAATRLSSELQVCSVVLSAKDMLSRERVKACLEQRPRPRRRSTLIARLRAMPNLSPRRICANARRSAVDKGKRLSHGSHSVPLGEIGKPRRACCQESQSATATTPPRRSPQHAFRAALRESERSHRESALPWEGERGAPGRSSAPQTRKGAAPAGGPLRMKEKAPSASATPYPPTGFPRSTFGDAGLNCRVRNGSG
jgi:hypothetical protein